MTDSLLDLSGKVALVTGGSRGLGKAMVTAFAAHGADVIIASRKLANCQDLAREITGQTGRGPCRSLVTSATPADNRYPHA